MHGRVATLGGGALLIVLALGASARGEESGDCAAALAADPGDPVADRRAARHAVYLLCDADVPFASDPQRSFPDAATRERSRQLWRVALESRGLPFVEIRGLWPERERLAIEAVEKLLRG